MIIELIKYANFYLSQKFFKEDYYYSDVTLNSTKNNSNTLVTYNKEKEYISKIAYISKSYQFCSIIRIYELVLVIQRPIMSIYSLTISQLISSLYNKLIEPQIKAHDKPIMIM